MRATGELGVLLGVAAVLWLVFRLADLPTPALKPACWPNVPHPTQGIVRALLRTRTVIAGERLKSYRCRACGAWHIGHLRGRP
jgi:hypothetical protein